MKKKIILNEARLNYMGGELFNDLDYKYFKGKISKSEHRRRCTERHVEFGDLLPYKKVNPVEWVDKIVPNLGKDKVKNILKEAIDILEVSTIYTKSEVGIKNLVFYKNANAYFKNRYLYKGKKSANITN